MRTAPVRTAPVKSAPVKSAPVKSAPVKSAPVKSAPVKSAPVKSAPVKSAPVKTAPVKTAPVKTAPVKTAPQVTPNLTGKSLTAKATQLVKAVLVAAKSPSAHITSTTRNAVQQARAMYENMIKYGVPSQEKLYKGPGKEVIKAFKDNSKKSAAEIIKIMADKITEVGPAKVSSHAPSSTHITFDIDPNSIKDRKAFEAEMAAKVKTGEVTKFLKPPTDPAYHIEMPK